ncbi:MAG: mechanosensitive ion channel [Oligoflexales bacterium]|nr:mechanosensitive ion channel [Oligoflexales bacterium]
MIKETLELTVLGNSLRVWTYFLITTSALYLVLSSFKYLLRRLSRFYTADENVIAMGDSLLLKTGNIFVLLLALYLGTHVLSLSELIEQQVKMVFIIVIFLQILLWGNSMISYWISKQIQSSAKNNLGRVTNLRGIEFMARAALYLIILLLALDNLGVNITALITGLGIAGIAVALAVQNILGDLLSSLTILLDKPFLIGDTIAIDTYIGSVENVGLKTTQLRSITGEQLIFSNTDLLKSRIRNMGNMAERRVLFSFKIDAETPLDKVAIIGELVKSSIETVTSVRFERATFKDFSQSFAFDFEVVYWVLNKDNTFYMKTHENINLRILESLFQQNIRLALPIQKYLLREFKEEADTLRIS